jgi:hypothetical protein
MYRTFYQQLVDSVGRGVAPWLLISVPALLFVALQVLATRAWRQRLGALEEEGGWRALLAAAVANSLRLSAGLAGVGFLCLALLVQAGLYSERHGNVTQRNCDAVKSKWGVAHEQHELKARLYVYELQTCEDFTGGGTRQVSEPAEPPHTAFRTGARPPSDPLAAPPLPESRAPEETADDEQVLSDETFQVDLDDKGKPKNPLAVAHRVKKLVRKDAACDAIVGAKIEITLRNSPRYLGGAGYAGFEDTCCFEYVVANQGERNARAAFQFPLPGEGQGLFNRLTVKLDGQDLAPALRCVGNALCWERNLAAGARHNVEISYESRGLESFRYWPGKLREQYLVRMRVVGVPPERLNFPIGAMSPADDLARLFGEDYTLNWDLSRAVTNYAMGIIVPAPVQPGFEVTKILREAPLGLALLALLLVATRLLVGARVSLLAVGLVLLVHYLGYTTFVHVSDLTGSFRLAFLAGMAVPAAAGVAFWIAHDGKCFAGIQSAALHVLFTLGYPLAVYCADYTGALLNAACVLLTAYVMFLAVRALPKVAPPTAVPASA